MAGVYCDTTVSFSIEPEELEVLQKAHDILDEVRHEWWLKDDDSAFESEDYYKLEESVQMLEQLFKCNKRSSE